MLANFSDASFAYPALNFEEVARKLRINERTLEKWEEGRAKPNPQAPALVQLVRRNPDTLERHAAARHQSKIAPAQSIPGPTDTANMCPRSFRGFLA